MCPRYGYEYTEDVNTFVANFHDAVLLYATALREAIDEKGFSAKRDGSLIVQKMWNRTIEGDSKGERERERERERKRERGREREREREKREREREKRKQSWQLFWNFKR